jgi:adenylosuccinate synthase
MITRIVVVSGAVASGKSQMARALCDRFQGKRYSTRELIVARVGKPLHGRRELQEAGERLDVETEGTWIRDALSREIYDLDGVQLVVVDAARIPAQIQALRDSFGRSVVHVHVTASDVTLEKRYEERRAEGGNVDELPSYADVTDNPTEHAVRDLAKTADIVIDSEASTEADVLTRVATAMGLLSSDCERLVDVIVGAQYGSEGKGNIAFYLASEYDLLVRVGGPNAGHKVTLASGEVYTHHHLPSGTRTSSARLLLGPGCVIRVERLLQEIADCGVDQDRLVIDHRAVIIEDSDIELEKRLRNRIGSTRQGVGWATARRILRGADRDMAPVRLAKDVPDLRPFVGSATDVLEGAYGRRERILLEGTQGTGLSLYHGPYPKVTSRDAGVAGALSEIGIAPRRVRRVILVCRTLPIRVGGKSGPLAQEISWDVVEDRAGFERGALKRVEKTSTTDRQRRVGEFEWDLLRRSAVINGPTDIALTFADYITRKNAGARRFDQLTPETIQFVEEVERVAGAPVSLISTGFEKRPALVDRRRW